MVRVLKKIINRSIKDVISFGDVSDIANGSLRQKVRLLSKSPKASLILEVQNDELVFRTRSSTKPDIVVSFDFIDIARVIFLNKNEGNNLDTDLIKISGNSAFENTTWEYLQNLVTNRKEVLYSLLSDTLLCSVICVSKDIKSGSGKAIKIINKKIENFLA